MPPPTATPYEKALLHARAVGFGLTGDALKQVQLALIRAAAEINARLLGAVGPDPLQQARFEGLRREIEMVLLSLEKRLAGVTGQAVSMTIDEVLAIHQEVVQEYAQQFLGKTLNLTRAFDSLPIRDLAVIAARGGTAQTFRTLVHRHMEDAAGALDTLLQSSIVRGVPVERLAKDVQALLVNPGATAAEKLYGLDPGELSGLSTLRSDARRIAASETLNALRESNAQALDASPLVSGSKWQLSGRHDGLRSSPDECDILAETDFYGLGAGMYPPDKWPLAPHPYCGCYQGAVRLRPPSEWGRSKPVSPPLQISPGNLQHLKLSDRAVNRIERTVSRSLGVAGLGPPRLPPRVPVVRPAAARRAAQVAIDEEQRRMANLMSSRGGRTARERPLGFPSTPTPPAPPPPVLPLTDFTAASEAADVARMFPEKVGFKKPFEATKAKLTGRKFDKDGRLVPEGLDKTAARARADGVNNLADEWGTTPELLVRRMISAPEDWTLEITRLSATADGEVSLSANFLGTGGQRLGGITRRLKLEEGLAEHDLLTLDPALTGAGLTKRLMREQVKLYDELGINTINVHANIDVGGYSWARYGFLPNQGNWDNLRFNLAEDVRYLQVDAKAKAHLKALLKLEDPRTIRTLAAAPGGKPLLLNSDWYGTMDLTNPETRAYFNHYVGE